MRDDDEDTMIRTKHHPEPRELKDLSIAAMEEYVTWLKGEQVRVEREIASRNDVKRAADQWFKREEG